MTEEKALEEIKRIIFTYIDKKKFNVFLFGSRVGTQDHHKYADFDIGIEGQNKIPTMIKMNIEEELEESDIPYMVDIVDFNTVSDDFRAVAIQHVLPLNK